FVTWKPRRKRLGRLRPVDDGDRNQRKADEDGEPNEKTAALHDAEAYGFPSPVGELAAATLSTRHRSPAGGPIRNGDPRVAVSFAESISLSSTGSADLRLPPTAFASGFDLLALRARRRWESRRGHGLPQEVRKTKRTQFARIQLSTFPQQTLQLVERTQNLLSRVSHMPHVPRPPSIDHGVISFLWAIGLGAYIYFGSLAVGISAGTAFIFAALGAFAIFIFVRVFGEDTPPRRYAARRRSQPRTSRD